MDYYHLAEQFVEALGEINRLECSGMQRISRDVMRGEMFVLIMLEKSGEPLSPGTISREAEISTARVAVLLNGLEKKGYIVRVPSEADRRMLSVSLTGSGREYLRSKKEELISHRMRVLMAMGEEDAKRFIECLAKLTEAERKVINELRKEVRQ